VPDVHRRGAAVGAAAGHVNADTVNRAGARRGPAAPADGVFRVSTEVWAIAFAETGSGTMIRTAQRKDQPAHGRFWIEPASGRVLMTELMVEDRSVSATITVSFQSEPLLGLLVPVAMRERYEGKRSRSQVDGSATYGRFRQF
jgi:hypothetical protein